MDYVEFLTIINGLKEEEVVCFKPLTKPVLNAYHPDIKYRLFQISYIGNDDYKVKAMAAIEERVVTKIKLGEMYGERKWSEYTTFDINVDFAEFQASQSS
ncbi:MAG: hypothetical protein WCF95_06590 [bacterium]